MELNHQTVLFSSALAALVLSLVQVAYGRRRDNFRPALDMTFGGLSFALLCVFYLLETRLHPLFQTIPAALVGLKILFIYRAVRGVFGIKAVDRLDLIVFVFALSFGCIAALFMSFAARQVLYGLYVAYFYFKAFILINRDTGKVPNSFLIFVSTYLTIYGGLFIARALYFLMNPINSTLYSLSDYGAETTLATLILFIGGNSGVLVIAVVKADRARNEALQSALDERDFATDLVSIVGHDLNGYLSGIIRGTELISDSTDPALPIISNYSAKTRNLLTDLVYYGRSRLESPDAVKVPCPVESLLSEAVNEVGIVAEAKNISICIPKDMGTRIVNVDIPAARVVLRNILQNSLKFSSSGMSVRIELKKQRNEIGIEISDEGRGMSRDQLQSAKDGRVVRSSEGTSGEQGTGTGLRIITSICRSQKWELDIRSFPGTGTNITVWFPLADSEL